MAFKFQSNLAENRAIHASEERGVSVPLAGTMRPLRPGMLAAPKAMHAPKMKTPKIPGTPGVGKKRKYYGEV
jgi:hypothetical protein